LILSQTFIFDIVDIVDISVQTNRNALVFSSMLECQLNKMLDLASVNSP